MTVEGNEVKLGFGLGGVTHGSESRGTFCDWHIRFLNMESDRYFRKWVRGVIAPSVSISYRIGGKFEPDFIDEIREPTFRPKYQEVSVELYLSLASFAPGNEENFRHILVGLIDEAVAKVVGHKRSPKVGIDVEVLQRQWQKLRADYMAVELPMAEPKRENSELVIEPSAEYYFEFKKKREVRSFEKAIAYLGLQVDWDDEPAESYYCCVTKHGDMGYEKEVESLLVMFAEEFGGEYDGWSA